uniref:G_PROTEIN_RECEP_F1_2 domain-containing protein n=1 Tax=Steinernema glaseri TaxID=37863 RepID=A0A1I7ZVS8_9BILA
MELQSYVNSYGYTFLGSLLVVFNLPVLVVASCSKELRNQYGVLILSLFNALLCGAVSVAYGVQRLILYSTGNQDALVTLSECLYNPVTFLLIWTFTLTGLGLLMDSIDRLLVITYPITYFLHNSTIVVVLNTTACVLNACIIFFAYFQTLHREPDVMVGVLCNHKEIFSEDIFIFLVSTRTCFAMVAIVLMCVVLLLLNRYHKTTAKQTFLTDAKIRRFRARQIGYTKTMLVSCVATILVFILPSAFAIVARVTDMPRQVTTWTRFITFFNSFNIAILIIYRQKDIRCRLFRIINLVLRKNVLQASAIETTGTDELPRIRSPGRPITAKGFI